MKRYYTDYGADISKGSTLRVPDTDGLFKMLIPVVSMPETKSAPNQQAKTVLSDSSITYTQGLQDNAQKTYTFNYHRDNIRELKKYANKTLTFLEENFDYTGEKFVGTLAFGRSAIEVDGVPQGQIFITVTEADEFPIDDVRDITKKTAILTQKLNDIIITGTETYEMQLTTLPANATITVESSAPTIATASVSSGKLTITGVAKGFCIISLTISAEGEASSTRTMVVEVESATSE